MTTDEQNSRNKGGVLVALALIFIAGIALVVYGISVDAKNTQVEIQMQRYDFELLESWQGNYHLMEEVKAQKQETEELAASNNEQNDELNQYKIVVVAITEDMIQLNQELAP